MMLYVVSVSLVSVLAEKFYAKWQKTKNLALGTWICPYGVRIVSPVLKLTRWKNLSMD